MFTRMWSPRRPLTALLALVAATQATCPDEWEQWSGHCYRLTAVSKPWHGIRGECKTLFSAADIASVTSEAENDLIKSITIYQNVWLGMRSEKGELSWLDGEEVDYTNFPSSSNSAEGAQDVVEMSGQSGEWFFSESHIPRRKPGVCKMASCQCPEGWTEWNQHCYLPQRQQVSWLEARSACRNMSDAVDLVTIIDQAENDFVYGLMNQYPFWIGLNDREKEGTYVWGTGEETNFTNWRPPSAPNGKDHKEDCAAMLRDRTWVDDWCGAGGRLKAFVCEMHVCGRGEQIPLETVGDHELRLWTPQDGLRCPEGWSRSASRSSLNCYSPPTAADTFSGVQRICSDRHPWASVAEIGSIEENDRVFFSASSLPVWVEYPIISAPSDCPSYATCYPTAKYSYWESDVESTRPTDSDCAAMQESSQWRPKKCEQERLPAICQLPACNPECTSDWTAHGGHCYRVERERRTLAEAAIFCQREGGHLASIQSQEENDFITTLAFKSGVDYKADPRAGHAWIGASRASREASWEWNDCDSWTISRWRNFDGNGTELKGTCATINRKGRWLDRVNCNARRLKLNSVCELDWCQEYLGPSDTSGCKSDNVR